MPFLPIAERELRVAARRKATYRTRFWAVLVAIIAFGWQLSSMIRAHIPSTNHGKYLFVTLSVLAFVYCLFIGARVTSDCLSEEKREGTLGLLFLTDLKGYDVVFGKLVASSLNAVYGLIAIVPLLAICLLLGGVSFAQFLKMVLVLITVLFFSLAAGIFVSTYNRLERTAMFFTILVILLCTLGPVLIGFVLNVNFGFNERNIWAVLMFSPAFLLLLTFEPNAAKSFAVPAFELTLAMTWLFTIFFLRQASKKLPHSWEQKEPKPSASKIVSLQMPQANKSQAKEFRANALEINPFLWLTLRGREKLNHAWGFVIAIIVIWFLGFLGSRNVMWDYELVFPTFLFIHAFLKIWVTSEACTRLVEDRRNGALELLLSTPLDVKEIIRGQHLALRRQFGGPFLLLIILETLCFIFGIAGRENNLSKKLFLPSAIVMFVTDFFTLRWVAMWIGLNARNVNRAVLKTALLILAMPWIIYILLSSIIPIFYISRAKPEIKHLTAVLCWIGIALLTNLILFRWAKPRLLSRFREVAVQPIGGNP
jgi:ABC-type transport system involved in cytochrome c biogenesis permease component